MQSILVQYYYYYRHRQTAILPTYCARVIKVFSRFEDNVRNTFFDVPSTKKKGLTYLMMVYLLTKIGTYNNHVSNIHILLYIILSVRVLEYTKTQQPVFERYIMRKSYAR